MLNMYDYLKDKKQGIWPDIKDWVGPHNEWRLEKDVGKLTWSQWFYFHPSAYALTSYGGTVIMILSFLTVGIISAVKGWWLPVGLSGLFVGLLIKQLVKQIKEWEFNKHITYYDLWLRDEPTMNGGKE